MPVYGQKGYKTQDIYGERAGGFRGPELAPGVHGVTQFILYRLGLMGEDYISNMHKAYIDALKIIERLPRIEPPGPPRIVFTPSGNVSRAKSRPFHKITQNSFKVMVEQLARPTLERPALIEFSGREEPSDDPRFANWPEPPLRRFYRLISGAPINIPTGSQGRKPKIAPPSPPRVEKPEKKKAATIKETEELPTGRKRGRPTKY